ncbi:MAG: MCP four helix bundle domain-containing protein, partial [Micromonosporaceae bacterium]|nr:MCP four helix bundle domain-containing protein [Micromonosporaceae bacterium]
MSDSGTGSWSLSSMGIRAKMTLTMILTMVVAVVVGVFGLWQMSDIAGHGKSIYQDALLPERDILTLRHHVSMVRYYSLSVATAGTEAAKQQHTESRTKEEQEVAKLLGSYKERNLTSEQRTSVEAFEKYWKDYQTQRLEADGLFAQKKMAEFEAYRNQKLVPTTQAFL